jgi:hypothetical protein
MLAPITRLTEVVSVYPNGTFPSRLASKIKLVTAFSRIVQLLIIGETNVRTESYNVASETCRNPSFALKFPSPFPLSQGARIRTVAIREYNPTALIARLRLNSSGLRCRPEGLIRRV